MGKVEHIFVAPQRGEPMRSVEQVEANHGSGLSGDRYAIQKNRRYPGCDMTLIESENIAAFTAATGAALSPDGPRRNVVTSGIRLNELVGKRFAVGTVIAEGVELCEPCKLFQKRTHKDILPFFIEKGGLRATVISSGRIAVGDDIVTAA